MKKGSLEPEGHDYLQLHSTNNDDDYVENKNNDNKPQTVVVGPSPKRSTCTIVTCSTRAKGHSDSVASKPKSEKLETQTKVQEGSETIPPVSQVTVLHDSCAPVALMTGIVSTRKFTDCCSAILCECGTAVYTLGINVFITVA